MDRLTLHNELMPTIALTRDGLLDTSINTCTVNTATDVITVAGAHGLSAGDQVRFSTTTTLPAPLTVNTRYYVLSAGLTSTDLKISTVVGGSPVDLTTTGTGTHTIWKNSKWEDMQTGLGYQGAYVVIDDIPLGAIGSGDVTLPDGYLGHVYSTTWTATTSFTVALLSGSLPLGLTLIQPDSFSWRVSGTPTTLGTYSFVLRVSRSGAFQDGAFHLTINSDPDEGTGGMIGG